jgi:hypothetical protein
MRIFSNIADFRLINGRRGAGVTTTQRLPQRIGGARRERRTQAAEKRRAG